MMSTPLSDDKTGMSSSMSRSNLIIVLLNEIELNVHPNKLVVLLVNFGISRSPLRICQSLHVLVQRAIETFWEYVATLPLEIFSSRKALLGL